MHFLKMHGLGNDFVIIDERQKIFDLSKEQIKLICDRHFGVGCDQFVSIREAEEADAHILFWNQDGSPSGACGNATRCVAARLMLEKGQEVLKLRSERGILTAQRNSDGVISVNMGLPILEWENIPLANQCDIGALPIEGAPMAVGMGNPHCVFFVADAEAVALEKLGPEIEHHELYPERANVEFVSELGKDHLRMRVWERGGMVTMACGSGACAVAVAANQRGLTGKKVRVDADGGTLFIELTDEGVWMSGETKLVFEGRIDENFWGNGV